MKVAGIRFDAGRHPGGTLIPDAIVLHRTFGNWPGDYAIGKNGRDVDGDGDRDPIGFHFLIGRTQAVQFYDTSTLCNHARGANTWSVGIEFEGPNNEKLTQFQVDTGRKVIDAVARAHNIPITYTTSGRRRKINGCLPHLLVPESDHTDYVTLTDWWRMFPGATPPPYVPADVKVPTTRPTPTSEEDDMKLFQVNLLAVEYWLVYADGFARNLDKANGEADFWRRTLPAVQVAAGPDAGHFKNGVNELSYAAFKARTP